MNGQEILDVILYDFNYIDFLEYTSAVLEINEEGGYETFEVREQKSWSIDIE